MKLALTATLSSVLILTGCATSVIKYIPATAMSVEDSSGVLEELMMTQHMAWRPNRMEINDKYLLWDYGVVSRGSGSAVVVGNAAFGGSITRTRGSAERIYFKSIDRIELRSWIRKFRQWYVVTAVKKRRKGITHMLRTRDLEDAKRFVDAFESLLVVYGD